jgi:hypothetical protein
MIKKRLESKKKPAKKGKVRGSNRSSGIKTKMIFNVILSMKKI